MFIKENDGRSALPLYEVAELSMEEALLVLAAEKEIQLKAPPPSRLDWLDWQNLGSAESMRQAGVAG